MFKKIATFVCAMAMAVSAFTGVVANAAVARDQGVNLVAEKSGDNTITLNVYAVGFSSIRNFGLNYSITGADVTGVNADYSPISGGSYNAASSSLVATGASSTSEVTLTNNLICTLTLTFAENISDDVTITLADESTIMLGNRDTLEYYVDDLESDPEYVTLGFNDVVVEAGQGGQEEPTYYDKGFVFTTSNDVAAKKFTTLKINVNDTTNNENKPGYAEIDISEQIATITGPAALKIFIKNIPEAYEVTSVELD